MRLRHAAVAVLGLCGLACAQPISLGTPCELNSDCSSALVCRHARCRVACREARDCGPGLRCVLGEEGVLVCSLPAEEECSASRPCPGSLACVERECRTECASDAQCTATGACRDDRCIELTSGADAGVGDAGRDEDAGPSCTETPMICGDGVVQTCDVARHTRLRGVLLGRGGGELQVLAPRTFGGIELPSTAAIGALPPQVAIAATAQAAPGFGVVGWIDGGVDGTAGTLVLHRFPLDGRGPATPIPDLAITGVRSLALSEDGSAVAGFAIGTPPTPGSAAAWVLTIEAAIATPVTLYGDPSEARGRLAIIGGDSAMLGTTFPRFLINRHDGPPVVEGERVLGAVDEHNSFDDYRIVTTTTFSSAPYFDSAGSAGNLVVVRDPGTPGLGAWYVSRTTPYAEPAEVAELGVIAGIGLTDVVGPPAVALADGTGDEYVIAFPTGTSSTGAIRFVRLRAAAGETWPPVTPLATIASVTALPPVGLAMARVTDGYAYATIEPADDASRRVYLRYLDGNGEEVPLWGDDPARLDPILAPPADPGQRISDVQISATRGGDGVTILVAALIRDDAAAEDLVWVGGVRACFAE